MKTYEFKYYDREKMNKLYKDVSETGKEKLTELLKKLELVENKDSIHNGPIN